MFLTFWEHRARLEDRIIGSGYVKNKTLCPIGLPHLGIYDTQDFAWKHNHLTMDTEREHIG